MMKRLIIFLVLAVCFATKIVYAQAGCSILTHPSLLGIPKSTFKGDPQDNIPLNNPACHAFGMIPSIIDENILSLWYTYHMAHYDFSKIKPKNPLSYDKEYYDFNVKIQEVMGKQLPEEFIKIKNTSIPTYVPSHLGIKILSPFKIIRTEGIPGSFCTISPEDKVICGFQLKADLTINKEKENLWRYLPDFSAIFITNDNYVYCAESITEDNGASIYFQLDYRNAFVINNIAKIIIVKRNGTTINEARMCQKTLYQAYDKKIEECKDLYRKQFQSGYLPSKNEPECFKFISVAHELLSSKYSQHPPTYEKYGIGRCKHTPKHRGAGSVGIHKTMSPVCFEDNNSIEVTAYKDDETGGIEAVLFRGSPISMKHHLCNIDGDLRSATYVYKGKARSTFYKKGTIDLYANAKCRVEIGEDCSYIVFQRIKNTPKQTEPAKTKKKPEKKPYIKKQWPQGSKPGKIRKNPNIQAAGIGQINAGDTFVIINEQSEWSQVDLDNGTSGWIKNDEIASAKNANDAPDVTPEKTIPSGQAAIEQPDSSLEDFAFINELIHLKDFKKIRERLASEGWNPTEPKDDYAGSIYLGKVFDAKSPKTNSKIHITKKGKKVDITLFLKKINLEAVKGKMKEIEYSYDQSHLNKQNSDRHSFKNPEGYKADLVFFKNSMKPYVSFSAP